MSDTKKANDPALEAEVAEALAQLEDSAEGAESFPALSPAVLKVLRGALAFATDPGNLAQFYAWLKRWQGGGTQPAPAPTPAPAPPPPPEPSS